MNSIKKEHLEQLYNEVKEDKALTIARHALSKTDIYRAYLDGYFAKMKDVINAKEIELLPYSILVITEELALRFLGDYINGDKYFGVDYPTHNLVRAKTQIALAKDIIKHLDDLKQITNEIVQKYK